MRVWWCAPSPVLLFLLSIAEERKSISSYRTPHPITHSVFYPSPEDGSAALLRCGRGSGYDSNTPRLGSLRAVVAPMPVNTPHKFFKREMILLKENPRIFSLEPRALRSNSRSRVKRAIFSRHSVMYMPARVALLLVFGGSRGSLVSAGDRERMIHAIPSVNRRPPCTFLSSVRTCCSVWSAEISHDPHDLLPRHRNGRVERFSSRNTSFI